MGFTRHHVLKCHHCKRRKALGGTKHGGTGWEEGGWKFMRLSDKKKKMDIQLLCPTCVAKWLTRSAVK
jgi:hypothetical protein